MLILSRNVEQCILFKQSEADHGVLQVRALHSDWVLVRLWRNHRGKTAPFTEHLEFESKPQGVFCKHPHQLTFFGPKMSVSINEISASKVHLGIDVPDTVLVLRTEKLADDQKILMPELELWV